MALTDNIVAYYKLDWNSNDSVGSNNGTDTSVSYVAGKIGNAGSYNGTSSKTVIPNSTGLNITGNQISFSFWINPTATQTNNWILFKGADNSQWVYSMWFFSGADMKMCMRLNGSTTIWSGEVRSSWDVSLNTWTHIAGIYNWSTQKIYINWTEVWSQNYSASLSSNTNDLILWYYFSQSFDFQWLIDEVWIWSRALSSTEITQLYNGWAWLTYPFASSTNSAFFAFF
jgi:hypothetical protein